MVWTPEQTGAFLDRASKHRLYALFHLIAFRGLRRGEACGQQWTDTDLGAEHLTVTTQLVQRGWKVEESAPKTDSGERVVALDSETVKVLKKHRKRQMQERLTWGEAYVDTGRVFTQENGEWLHPAWVTDQFRRLAAEAGLPPIRLHDLRHGAATLALAASAEMKVVQEMLGHSSITITSDTYTSVLPEVARKAAEAAVKLVPRQAARTAGLTSGQRRPRAQQSAPPEAIGWGAKPQVKGSPPVPASRRPCRTRTDNQRIKRPPGIMTPGVAPSREIPFPQIEVPATVPLLLPGEAPSKGVRAPLALPCSSPLTLQPRTTDPVPARSRLVSIEQLEPEPRHRTPESFRLPRPPASGP